MRVLVIANKQWEADPLVSAFLAGGEAEALARSPAITGLEVVHHPVVRPSGDVVPRLRCRAGGAAVEVWCLQDVMSPSAHPSSSAEKARVLPSVFAAGDPPALVVAVGTAAFPDSSLAPGSVVAGTRFFLHDAHPAPADDPRPWRPEPVDTVIDGAREIGKALAAVRSSVAPEVEHRFVRGPFRPADEPILVASGGFVSLGTVNVTDYAEYAEADRRTVEAFALARGEPLDQAVSIETTHGLMGLEARRRGARFVFVSGVANALGRYEFQVRPRTYVANFVAAHNAGVAVAWLTPGLIAAAR